MEIRQGACIIGTVAKRNDPLPSGVQTDYPRQQCNLRIGHARSFSYTSSYASFLYSHSYSAAEYLKSLLLHSLFYLTSLRRKTRCHKRPSHPTFAGLESSAGSMRKLGGNVRCAACSHPSIKSTTPWIRTLCSVKRAHLRPFTQKVAQI